MDHRTGLFTQIMRILPGASFRVLTALLLSQERLTQVRLQSITANSDKTISKALDRLRELGLAECYYPGWEATDLARRLAEQAGLCQAQPEQQIPPAADSAGRNNSGSVTASARENPVQPASQVAHPARVGDSPGQSFSTSQPAQAQDRQPQQASGQVPIPGRVEPVADSAGRNNSGSVTASTRENPVQPAPQVAHPARVGDSPGRSFSASQPAQAQDRQPQQASGQVLPVQQGVLPGEIPVSRKVSDSPAPTTTNTKNLLINTESLLVVAGGKGRRFSDLFEITLQAGQPPPGDQPVRPCGKLPGFPACSGFARQQACEGRPAYPRQPVQAQPAVAIAHLIVRLVYCMLKYQVEYEPLSVAEYEKHYRKQQFRYLHKKAAGFGFQLTPA